MKLIDKDALVAEIERLVNNHDKALDYEAALEDVRNFLYTFKEKEVDLQSEIDRVWDNTSDNFLEDGWKEFEDIAKHFFELGVKAQHDNWKVVDNINPPQANRNKIYCVLSKNKYLLARVIDHPQDDDLLQWRCTEFPFHRYDMCEGDKYMQIG